MSKAAKVHQTITEHLHIPTEETVKVEATDVGSVIHVKVTRFGNRKNTFTMNYPAATPTPALAEQIMGDIESWIDARIQIDEQDRQR